MVKVIGKIRSCITKNIDLNTKIARFKHQNCHTKCSSSKVMVKDRFCKMVDNVTLSCTSHVQTVKIFLSYL